MTNGLKTQPGSTVLSSSLDLSDANVDAHEPQLNSRSDRLFGSSLFGNNTAPSGGLFGRSSGSTPPKPKRFQAKLPYSLASCETARKDNFGCTCNSQNLSEARVPAKRKQSFSFGTRSCELHESWLYENKQQFISNFILTHLPTFQLERNTQHAGSGPESEHFKHILIGHARVWCFAREYALVSLAGLARENLIRQLVHWVMSEDTFIPIFGELVRLVYHDCTDGENSLHHVLAQFASCVFEDVRLLEGWHGLIAEVPSFSIDLVYKLTDRCA